MYIFFKVHISSDSTEKSPSNQDHSTDISTMDESSSTQNSSSNAFSPLTPSKPPVSSHGLTSTPNIVTAAYETEVEGPDQPICEGSFTGKGRHRDGTPLAVIFQVKTTIISQSNL